MEKECEIDTSLPLTSLYHQNNSQTSIIPWNFLSYTLLIVETFINIFELSFVIFKKVFLVINLKEEIL